MMRIIQEMYKKHAGTLKGDQALADLLEKACAAYGKVMNEEWLEWGAVLMPDMLRMIQEAERQAKIEWEMMELAEWKENRTLRIDVHNSRKAQYVKEIMVPGATIEHIEKEFQVLDEAQAVDDLEAMEDERRQKELVASTLDPSLVSDMEMEGEDSVTYRTSTFPMEGESELGEDKAVTDGVDSGGSKRITRQAVYIAAPLMPVERSASQGERGPVSGIPILVAHFLI